jgi:hypothetical protein
MHPYLNTLALMKRGLLPPPTCIQYPSSDEEWSIVLTHNALAYIKNGPLSSPTCTQYPRAMGIYMCVPPKQPSASGNPKWGGNDGGASGRGLRTSMIRPFGKPPDKAMSRLNAPLGIVSLHSSREFESVNFDGTRFRWNFNKQGGRQIHR